jgi:hypothetical protein
MEVPGQEHLRPLREPTVAWVLVDSPIQLLHDALSPLDRRRRLREDIAEDRQDGEPGRSTSHAERGRQADERDREPQPEPRLPSRDEATQPVGMAVRAAERHGAPPTSGLP